jgi:hypothetical protein
VWPVPNSLAQSPTRLTVVLLPFWIILGIGVLLAGIIAILILRKNGKIEKRVANTVAILLSMGVLALGVSSLVPLVDVTTEISSGEGYDSGE